MHFWPFFSQLWTDLTKSILLTKTTVNTVLTVQVQILMDFWLGNCLKYDFVQLKVNFDHHLEAKFSIMWDFCLKQFHLFRIWKALFSFEALYQCLLFKYVQYICKKYSFSSFILYSTILCKKLEASIFHWHLINTCHNFYNNSKPADR